MLNLNLTKSHDILFLMLKMKINMQFYLTQIFSNTSLTNTVELVTFNLRGIIFLIHISTLFLDVFLFVITFVKIAFQSSNSYQIYFLRWTITMTWVALFYNHLISLLVLNKKGSVFY